MTLLELLAELKPGESAEFRCREHDIEGAVITIRIIDGDMRHGADVFLPCHSLARPTAAYASFADNRVVEALQRARARVGTKETT